MLLNGIANDARLDDVSPVKIDGRCWRWLWRKL